MIIKTRLAIATMLCSLGVMAQATEATISGKIEEIAIVNPAILLDGDYVSMGSDNGNITATTCSIFGGFYAFRIPDNATGTRLMTQLLLAEQANYTITLTVNDNDADAQGYCFVQQVETNPDLHRYRIR